MGAVRRTAALAGLFAAACGAPDPGPARHAILISIDTLRADFLGAYGEERPTSPTLDALAEEGALFENATTPAPWTLPAHASLLTGAYPVRHGAVSHRKALAEEVPTWVEVLRARGFAASAVVNSVYLSERHGLDRGFDEHVYVEEQTGRRSPTRVEQEALEWLARFEGERFFLFLHFYDVHSDYKSLGHYERPFLRPYRGDVDGSTGQLLAQRAGQRGFSEADRRRLLDLYAASVRQMDDGIRHLLEGLREQGLLEDTVLAVTSDHGEEFLEHGSVLHGRTHYEEVMRVPLILRGPRVPRGVRIDLPVSLVDVGPTLLGLLGLRPPSGVDGRDLRPLLRGRVPASLRERSLFAGAAQAQPLAVVRRGPHKLVVDLDSGRRELYDLGSDPAERRDLAEARPERAEELHRLLREHRAAGRAGAPVAELSERERAQLRDLGYLDPGPGEGTSR